MAKDNIPFHTIIFPATQIVDGRNWTMLKHINSTEYLNYEGEKFSKSRNIGVFGMDVINIGFPIDFWRFYLLITRPEKQDTSFSWEDFFQRVNKEFIDNVCNLINRVLVFLNKNFNGKVYKEEIKDIDFINIILEEEIRIENLLEQGKLKDALKGIIFLSKEANKFFQKEEPWVLIKKDRDKTHKILSLLVYLIKDIAILLSSYMPDTSNKIFNLLQSVPLKWNSLGNFSQFINKELNKPKIIYEKLDEKLIKKYKEKFKNQ